MADLTPIARVEHFLARIAGDPGKVLTPQTRIENFLQRIIDNGGSGGGEVTPASIVTATGQMTTTQKNQTRTNIGAASSAEQANLIGRVSNLEGRNIPVTGSDPTITPSAFGIYNCGTLTSLTITDPPATGSYSIVFTSGSTATTTSIPATILGLENFAAEANTLYEINVLDNRAVVGSWAVSSS